MAGAGGGGAGCDRQGRRPEARGLGLREAADTYYRRALDAGKQYGCGADCEGFNVPRLASAALGR